MHVHAIIERPEDEVPVVHLGFATDEAAVNWASVTVTNPWEYAQVAEA